MSNDATVEDVIQAYLEAWKLGLKAVAIYRDGCKRVQPLATGGKKVEPQQQQMTTAELAPRRRHLPMERQAICHKFEVAGHEGYIHVGFYEDGAPGEIFIKMAKEGSTISGLMDTIATLTSLALQYGVPLEALVSKFGHVRFEPSGFTKNPNIPYAKSLTDYIFRFLGSRFLSTEQKQSVGLIETGEQKEALISSGSGEVTELTKQSGAVRVAAPVTTSVATPQANANGVAHGVTTWQSQADAPSCADCGSIMIRNGSCYKCLNCGATSGCS